MLLECYRRWRLAGLRQRANRRRTRDCPDEPFLLSFLARLLPGPRSACRSGLSGLGRSNDCAFRRRGAARLESGARPRALEPPARRGPRASVHPWLAAGLLARSHRPLRFRGLRAEAAATPSRRGRHRTLGRGDSALRRRVLVGLRSAPSRRRLRPRGALSSLRTAACLGRDSLARLTRRTPLGSGSRDGESGLGLSGGAARGSSRLELLGSRRAFGTSRRSCSAGAGRLGRRPRDRGGRADAADAARDPAPTPRSHAGGARRLWVGRTPGCRVLSSRKLSAGSRLDRPARPGRPGARREPCDRLEAAQTSSRAPAAARCGALFELPCACSFRRLRPCPPRLDGCELPFRARLPSGPVADRHLALRLGDPRAGRLDALSAVSCLAVRARACRHRSSIRPGSCLKLRLAVAGRRRLGPHDLRRGGRGGVAVHRRSKAPRSWTDAHRGRHLVPLPPGAADTVLLAVVSQLDAFEPKLAWVQKQRKENGPARAGPEELSPATSYSPTRSPGQYHRR